MGRETSPEARKGINARYYRKHKERILRSSRRRYESLDLETRRRYRRTAAINNRNKLGRAYVAEKARRFLGREIMITDGIIESTRNRIAAIRSSRYFRIITTIHELNKRSEQF